ncbi:hypothetical protein BKM31_41255 [[Actinomadura] parvosata subsp. kistnae]|uniref:Uncharacterized protein n=1 Tax=[Actinomadura] parvosata subsp. kistnae TaxID=1909395 RepID=A0A1V0A9X6_9ACTN|nr:hypothetical protein BKM31_41255 [Nonomuraea sp. ATCC 55076]
MRTGKIPRAEAASIAGAEGEDPESGGGRASRGRKGKIARVGDGRRIAGGGGEKSTKMEEEGP